MQRRAVDVEGVAIYIQEPYEPIHLAHLIQDDAREFFPMRRNTVSGGELNIAHAKGGGFREQLAVNSGHRVSGVMI
jgi:hypothetical protein